MSLYYDAVTVLSTKSRGGSLKSRIYKDNELKSKPDQIYALISQTAKYDHFLKEVIEVSGLLAQESKLTPILSILLLHDHFFSKNGIAAPLKHPLRQAIERHKARLQAEFTRARLKRKCASVDLLKKTLEIENAKNQGSLHHQPRWIRVNVLKSGLHEQLDTTFNGYRSSDSLTDVMKALPTDTTLYIDGTIPDLIACPPNINITASKAYEDSLIILQDKASCFPAYLLLGNIGKQNVRIGDIIDACAAPGNKTTHLAALLESQGSCLRSTRKSTIFACERDSIRLKTLERMVSHTGADNMVSILPRQDFLFLNPNEPRFANVTHLLLDPSCSGSGIINREDIPKLALPEDPRNSLTKIQSDPKHKSKKRKRIEDKSRHIRDDALVSNIPEILEKEKQSDLDHDRLSRLSNIQSQLLEHAFTFPAATHITYSTCSVHVQENEAVVIRVLNTSVAKERGWRVLTRNEQVAGLRDWKHRGIALDSSNSHPSNVDEQFQYSGERLEMTDEQREACIRCSPEDEEGVMGFFVCGFIRQTSKDGDNLSRIDNVEESWEGFSDTD